MIKMDKSVIVFIAFAVAITGCTGYTGGNPDQIETYRSGSQGLTVRFMDNTPPPKLFDDQQFNALLEIWNKGATDIQSNARVYLSGFDTSIIMGISSDGELIQDLGGKSMYNAEGEFTTVDFRGTVRDLESKNVDYYDTPILATVCYGYETIAAPTICVDPDPFGHTRERKVCSATTVENLGGNQGAPVAVSEVQVEPAPGKSRIKITVSNVGGGTVIREGAGYLTQCNPFSPNKLEYDDVDFVRLDEVRIGDQTITGSCRPVQDQHIRLVSGRGSVWCELDGLEGSTYKTPMTVRISYNYRDTAEKTIRIVQTP